MYIESSIVVQINNNDHNNVNNDSEKELFHPLITLWYKSVAHNMP